MVLRRYALSIIALAILESGQWLKRELRFSFFYKAVLSPMVLRRYALSIIALAILESGQWLKTKKDILVGVFLVFYYHGREP